MIRSRRLFVALAGLALASTAHAHVGPEHASGFAAGLAHPLGGLDHLLAAIGVSLFAVQCGGRAVWLAPAGFVATLLAAALAAHNGMHVPFGEAGIALSVVAIGALLLGAARIPTALGFGLVALAGLWHGHAHGAEMPAAFSATQYLLGIAASTALLHGQGIGLGVTLRKFDARALRWTGAALAGGGVWLLAGL